MLGVIILVLLWIKAFLNECVIGLFSGLGGFPLLWSCSLWVSKLCFPHCNLLSVGSLFESSEFLLKSCEFALLCSDLASNLIVCSTSSSLLVGVVLLNGGVDSKEIGVESSLGGNQCFFFSIVLCSGSF